MPLIGIFWVHKEKVIGQASPLCAGKEYYPGLLDSPKNHTDLWGNDRTLLADAIANSSMLQGRQKHSECWQQSKIDQ